MDKFLEVSQLFENKSDKEIEYICRHIYEQIVLSYGTSLHFIVRFLVNKFPYLMFFLGIHYNDIKLVQLFIEEYSVTYHQDNNTALLIAVQNKYDDLIDYLLEQNAIIYDDIDSESNIIIDNYLKQYI
jgi:oligoribonuclease (3'-5' exoribonuclease)